MSVVYALTEWAQREPGSVFLLIFATILAGSLTFLLPDFIRAFCEWKNERIKAANEEMFKLARKLRELREEAAKKGLQVMFLAIFQLLLTSTARAVDLGERERVMQELAQGRWDMIITGVAAVVIVFLVWLIIFYLPCKRREKEIEQRHLHKGGMWN